MIHSTKPSKDPDAPPCSLINKIKERHSTQRSSTSTCKSSSCISMSQWKNEWMIEWPARLRGKHLADTKVFSISASSSRSIVMVVVGSCGDIIVTFAFGRSRRPWTYVSILHSNHRTFLRSRRRRKLNCIRGIWATPPPPRRENRNHTIRRDGWFRGTLKQIWQSNARFTAIRVPRF